MNSGFSGRWDRNRTCTLRFWRPKDYLCCLPLGFFCGPVTAEAQSPKNISGHDLGSIALLLVASQLESYQLVHTQVG